MCTIATTQSADDAWEAHRLLLTLRGSDSGPVPESTPGGSHNAPRRPRAGPAIPFAFSHRLARLLAAAKPRTRTQFLRLLTVLADVKKDGGTIHRWEWNALIDCAGRGWRKTRPADYKAALDVFEDMISQPPPEESTTKDGRRGSQPANAAPDIVTYTTLLHIAARTLTPDILRHASTLLQESDIPHNRVTHLATLRFFTRTNRLSGVRSTVMRMREQGFALGLDGVNACLTAFARNARVDVASTIYRVLRHNVAPEGGVGAHDIDAAVRYLDTMEGILIPAGMAPDRVTYTAMIQAFAYHGDLIQALHVFTHMLSSPDLEPFAPRISRGEDDKLVPADYPTTLPVFRALFLGFARHAQPPQSPSANTHKFSLATRLESRDGLPPGPKSPWTVANLRSLFKTFLELPAGTRPSDRTIYWILVAFSKATGDDDVKLRQIWEQLQSRFEGRWGGRIELSRKRIYGELPSEEEQWEDV
ncbi:hypothetical protein FIBSPDRAFT_750725 [Athelia psychrophila]|uniref:Pentacotripeptide-repeat region of PRORP domain-containing protein n=1 Tax=Athelia psychrophila TaxID=1759441 RepID=A0A166DX41_9AGAM|nr:hypothetical protein FIBSPDRAFT_750725 [Fibularhizoctonia sp. CBS 109695]